MDLENGKREPKVFFVETIDSNYLASRNPGYLKSDSEASILRLRKNVKLHNGGVRSRVLREGSHHGSRIAVAYLRT